LKRQTNFMAPMMSRPLHHWIFCVGICKKFSFTHTHRKSEIHIICRRELRLVQQSLTKCFKNMRRNWIPSRCLQGYEWHTLWDLLLCAWKLHELMNTLQQIQFLQFSSHKSYYITKLCPPSFMTVLPAILFPTPVIFLYVALKNDGYWFHCICQDSWTQEFGTITK